MSVLDLFPSEKTAAEPAFEERRKKAIKPDRGSLDPGERALAGMLAGTALAKTRGLVQLGLLAKAVGGSKQWVAPPLLDQKTLKDAFTSTSPGRAKLLGLYDVKARTLPASYKDPKSIIRQAERYDDLAKELAKIQPVVDSFIKKHKLTEKGVRLNLHRNLLSLTPSYDPLKKRVHLPMVSAPMALHELGHAADYARKGGAVRRIAGVVGNRTAMVALPAALIAGDKIKEMIPGSVDDKAISFLQDNAPALGAATLAATSFIPEVKATKYALEHIRQVQGRGAARAAAKTLLPALGTYLMSYVPIVVGLSFAKKYMEEGRSKGEPLQDLQKAAGLASSAKAGASFVKELGSNLRRTIAELAIDTEQGIENIGRQLKTQHKALLQDPNMGRRILSAAKETATDPQFIASAVGTSVPATLGALYFYGTPSGKEIRDRMGPTYSSRVIPQTVQGGPLASRTREEWREQHPLRFAGLVGLGFALSGGVISKLLTDIRRVL